MHIHGVAYRAVFCSATTPASVFWVDQTKLPFQFSIKESGNPEDVLKAITMMEVRGAPTIGAAAAYGLALAYRVNRTRFQSHWLPRFRKARPTAVNLHHACQYMESIVCEEDLSASHVMEAAQDYADQEVKRNKRLGQHLAELLAIGEQRIQTHCNAGWLAAVDWGTALSGVYELSTQGEKPSVLVNETRPRMQGAKLTAWELQQEGVHCHVQVDGAAAWMMAKGMTDVVVVGADRIAKNGDVANKIGTYMLALAAKAHGIPFYVAAPTSTWDDLCHTGLNIPIEHRGKDEVLGMENNRFMTEDIEIMNPAFDITPFDLITGIVTENGIYRAEKRGLI